MVRVEFVDRDGVSGVVDTDLLVEYDGSYGEVETHVNAVKHEYRADAEPGAPEEAFEELLIDLPQRLPVREARLSGDDVPTSPRG